MNEVDILTQERVWKRMVPLPSGRSLTGAAVMDDSIFVLGGRRSSTNKGGKKVSDLSDFIQLSPRGERWISKKNLPVKAAGPVLVPLNGILYAIVGPGENGVKQSLFAYDPAQDSWAAKANMRDPRDRVVAGEIDGKLYVAGGWRGKTRRILEVYDPREDKWEWLKPMPHSAAEAGGGVINGLLYVVGGNDRGYCTNRLQAYDPRTDRWFQKAPMETPRCSASAVVHDGLLYVLGGVRKAGGSTYRDIEVYDPTADIWMGAFTTPSSRRSKIYAHFGPFGRIFGPPGGPDVLRGAPAKLREDDFALVIGVENYRSVPKVTFGEKDAEAVGKHLRHYLGVPKKNLIVLKGQGAARTDLAGYLEEWLPRNVNKNSRVYFYFSGHGAPDPVKGTAYLVPWDGNAKFLKSSAYPLSRLYAQLKKLEAKEIVVMLDACFSGAGGRSIIAEGLRPLRTIVTGPAVNDPRLVVLTASRGDEVAGSSAEEGHGLFTYYLLEGLRGGADSDKDGHLKVRELHSFIKGGVRGAAKRDNRDQTPQLFMGSGGLRFY